MLYKIAIALVITLVVFAVYKNYTIPSYLGVNDGMFSPMPSSPNAVSSQTDNSEMFVEPLSYEAISDAKKTIKRVLAQMPGNQILTEQDNYLHIVFTTETMSYHDDVELYFDDEQKLLHYRSQSRVGYSDKGLNRERYELFSSFYSELK